MEANDKIPTGIGDLDKKLEGGITWCEISVIAGRPGMGKTALAISMAANMAKAGENVVYITLAESAKYIEERIKKTGIGVEDKVKVVEYNADDFDAVDLYRVASQADIVFLDYIDLFHFERLAREYKGMSAAVEACGFSLVILAQVSKAVECRLDKRPMPKDIRAQDVLYSHEYQSYKNDPAATMILYRDGYYFPRDEYRDGMKMDIEVFGDTSIGIQMRRSATAYFRGDTYTIETYKEANS